MVTHSEAIGHFVRETEILNCMLENKDYGERYKIILCTQKRVSNRYFLSVLQDSFFVAPWPIGILCMKIMNHISGDHRVKNLEFSERRNIYLKKLHTKPSNLVSSFRMKQMLEHVNESHPELAGRKIVIVAFRDEGYDFSINPKFEPQTQSYRNTPLEHFIPLLSDLVAQDFTIVRVGRHNQQHVTDVNKHAIEISDLSCQDNSMCDFAMFYHAKLVITTGTGIDEIGLLLRKPTIYLNVAPFGQIEQTEICKGILATTYFDESLTKIQLAGLIDSGLHLVNPAPLIKKKSISLKPRDPEVIRKYVALIMNNMTKKSPAEIARIAGGRNLGEYRGCVVY